jgi:hypothetical protein
MDNINTNQESTLNNNSQATTNATTQQLPKTIEELQALLQKEGDKRVSSARKKFELEFNSKLEAEKEEATRLAKLSKAEREREAFEKEREAFELEKKELARQKAISEVVTELQTEGLPTMFSDKLLGKTNEDTLENIKTFKKIWQEAIQKEVDNRLVTKTPKMGQSKTNTYSSIFDEIKSKKVR